MAGKETPLMKQYWEVKSAHSDKIVFFRMGDFFELFHDDAVLAAPLLDIVLTSRNKKAEDETPMCGFPHHSVANHINKLLQHGYKVAICDQVEDPKLAKGLVKRAVTRILSPGMVFDPDTLDSLESHYLASWDDGVCAFLEPTTGECFYFKTDNPAPLLRVLRPREVLLPQDCELPQGFESQFHLTRFEAEEGDKALPAPARRLLAYAVMMQGQEILQSLLPFAERALQARVQISPTTLRHLEVFETYKGKREGSLFWAIDRTKTSAGARMLRQWLTLPLGARKDIESRQKKVAEWVAKPQELTELRKALSKMGDLERRLGKLSNPGCHPRDLQSLAHSLQAGLEVNVWLKPTSKMDRVADFSLKILTTLVDEPPLSKKEGGIIRKGVHAGLDELMSLTTDSQSKVQALEAREKEATGISSLKVRYNNVFGFYIEITNSHRDKVPSHYLRKQTLVNAERYVTDELLELERKVLSAKSRREELEYEMFEELRREALLLSQELLSAARVWALADVITGFAWLALERRWVQPEVGDLLVLENSRHPVLEQIEKSFVPNTVRLESGQVLLLTGPNMAGKSTLMRQVALIALLHQVGSFVPASRAQLPLFDQVFTRIGASDALTEGLSTFMVEMVETAEILKSATARSLIVMDEIGRGTSTYDGMSLAQAILEKLTHMKCMSTFATHYHELTRLEDEAILNAHMAIRERGGDIEFLHRLQAGPASRSYGIEVARRAGLPKSVVDRAQKVLRERETSQLPLWPTEPTSTPRGDSTELTRLSEVEAELQDIQPEMMTPLEALVRLTELKTKANAAQTTGSALKSGTSSKKIESQQMGPNEVAWRI